MQSILIEERKGALMINQNRVSLVMPCRNEAGHLAKFVADVPLFYDEIICVSNLSTDRTVEVGKELEQRFPRFTLLQDDRTAGGIGYGYAHLTGIEASTGDIVVCADSDGTYPIEDVPDIIDKMEDKGLDFASCSRYPDAKIPFGLQFGVKILNLEIALLYQTIIHDSLSGMWVFKRSVYKRLRLTEGDWNLSPQIKLNAHRYLGNKFGEVKIEQKNRHGETKQNYLKTGLNHLIWIAKNRFTVRDTIQPHD